MNKKIDLFIDSGAFSAWSQGAKINIKDYIKFIKKHKKHISVYANLDIIGDAEATLKNQKIMEKAGLSPLPCFHYGESMEYLKYYITNYKYIGLGGMVPISTKGLVDWLDKIFANYICDSKGVPKVKVHAFGMTSLKLIYRYPWYSIDSTTWVIVGRLGSVYIPRYVGKQCVYDKNSWKIVVSSRSPNKKKKGQHIDSLPPKQKEIILNYFKMKGYKLGKSDFEYVAPNYKLRENEKWAEKKNKKERRLIEIIREDGICNNYKLRDELNIIYFMDLEKSIPKYPIIFKLKNKTKGFGLV